MPNVVIPSFNFLSVIVDVKTRRCLNDFNSEQTREMFVFSRGDTLKGWLYSVYPTGQSDPLWYQFNVPSYELALTDGASVVYCTATGWEAQGGTTNPHMTFNLEVMSTALDTALRSAGQSMSAVLEVHLTGFPASEGSTFPQDEYIIRDPAIIQQTALNPVPPVGGS